jgi:hypothetical protein
VLCLDHCHKTGRVRGMLCPLCNTSLGGFRDSTTVLQRAIDYLGGIVPSLPPCVSTTA